jgi:hypothetical protein
MAVVLILINILHTLFDLPTYNVSFKIIILLLLFCYHYDFNQETSSKLCLVSRSKIHFRPGCFLYQWLQAGVMCIAGRLYSCDGARLSSQHCSLLWLTVQSPDENECDQVSERDQLGLTPNLTTRDLWRSRWTRK